jgi:hypothetical protein
MDLRSPSEIAYANPDFQRQTEYRKLVYQQIDDLCSAELARRRIKDFTLWMKPDFIVERHHDYIFEHIDALLAGQIKRLRIEMPPRHGKSEIGSVQLPALALGMRPDEDIIHVSHSASLSNEFSRQVRDIVGNSPRFKALFPGVGLSKDRARIDDWRTDSQPRAGGFLSMGTGGALIGHGAHKMILDDPLKEGDADSPTVLKQQWNWFATAAQTRLMPGAWLLMIMQRWSPFDMAGELDRLRIHDVNADEYTVLRLPAIAGPNDPMGRAPGVALWPGWYPLERLKAIRAASPRQFDALYQQEPRSADTQMFTEAGFVLEFPFIGYGNGKRQAWTFDLAIGESEQADFTALGRWLLENDNLHVANIRRYQYSWPRIKKLIKRMLRAFPDDDFVFPPDVYELMAVQELRHECPDDAWRIKQIERKDFKGDKTERAQTLADRCETGRVYVQMGRFAKRFITEHVEFPGQNDDLVDMSSVATHYFKLHQEFSWLVAGKEKQSA